MLISITDLRKIIETDESDYALAVRLDAIEGRIRAYTNNHFLVTGTTVPIAIRDGRILCAHGHFSVGDTAEICHTAASDGIYTIIRREEGAYYASERLLDSDEGSMTLVRYPKDVASRLPRPDYQMGGYQMLVRGDIFRLRYREGFEKAVPVTPGKPLKVEFTLDDVAHWLLPGHRLMIQIQSSWFPLADLNPQTFVENIYHAAPDDYLPATMTVYHQKNRPSYILLPVKE